MAGYVSRHKGVFGFCSFYDDCNATADRVNQ
jgi:hypothetical protein